MAMVPVFTVDAKGRLTNAASVDISIAQTQVVNLSSDLSVINSNIALKQDAATAVNTSSVLSGDISGVYNNITVNKIKNVPFQFIYHNKNHFFGVKKIWVDNFHKVKCSDLEKTFIDCLFKPDYAGGVVEIAKAIYISKDKIKFKVSSADLDRKTLDFMMV